MSSAYFLNPTDFFPPSIRLSCLPITALEIVIFNHILSRISRPESGSCITLTIVAMSLFTVKGDSSNSKREKGHMLPWKETSPKTTSQLPVWMKRSQTQRYHNQTQRFPNAPSSMASIRNFTPTLQRLCSVQSVQSLRCWVPTCLDFRSALNSFNPWMPLTASAHPTVQCIECKTL